LQPDFVSRSYSATFLVVGPEVGQGFFFTEHFTLPWIQLFGKQISDHVTERPQTSAEATRKNYGRAAKVPEPRDRAVHKSSDLKHGRGLQLI